MQMPPAQSDHDSDSPHLHLTKHDETGEPLASLIAPLPNGQNIMLCWDMESFEEFVDTAHDLLLRMQIVSAEFFLVDCRSLGEQEHLIRAAALDHQSQSRGKPKRRLPALCGAKPKRGDDWGFEPLVGEPCQDCTCEGCLALYEQ